MCFLKGGSRIVFDLKITYVFEVGAIAHVFFLRGDNMFFDGGIIASCSNVKRTSFVCLNGKLSHVFVLRGGNMCFLLGGGITFFNLEDNLCFFVCEGDRSFILTSRDYLS